MAPLLQTPVKILYDILTELGLHLTNGQNHFILQFRNRLWIIFMNLTFHITPNKKVQRCQIT